MSTTARRVSLVLLFTVFFMAGQSRPAQAGAGAWTPVGPGAGWGYPGGIVSVTVHPSVPGAVWAGLPRGGLYRSSDQGVNWRWAGSNLFISNQGGISSVAADPSKPGALWAATRAGFFRTEDGGAHWKLLSGGDWAALVGADDPGSLVPVPGVLNLVIHRRLLASTDGGRTWAVLLEQGEEGAIQSFAVHPAAPRLLYLAVVAPDGSALVRSLDRGHTWTVVTTLPTSPSVIRQVVAAPAAVYVAVEGDEAGVLRSTDQGRTWHPVLGGTRERPLDVLSMAVDPRAPRTLYVSGVLRGATDTLGLWTSRNAGATWRRVGPRAVGFLRIDSAAGLLYAVESGNLLRSRDGGATWALVLRAPDPESSFARISFRPEDPARRTLSVGFTLYRSVNGGQSWKLAGSPADVRDVDIDPADPNRLIAVASSAAYVSENAGQTWQRVTGLYDFNCVELLVRADPQTLIAGGAGLYRSGDNGRTWQAVLPGWVPGVDTGRWAQKIAADPADPLTLYALTFLAEAVEPPHDELSELPSILWKSTDGGRTWKKVTLNLRTFAVDPGTSRLYGVRERQILASDDEGTSWQPIGQTPKFVHELVIDPTDPNVVYTAGYGPSNALSRSLDRGATWSPVSDSWMPFTLTFDPGNPRILYGADRWGVFKMTVPD